MQKDNSIASLESEFVQSADQNAISKADFDRLCQEFENNQDYKRLRRYLRRRQLGEPLEYILGYLTFREHTFFVDKRVYITDPELSYFVDAVINQAQQFENPVIVECGIGCGSLSISVKKECPTARVIGLDLDSDAIELALRN